METYAVAAIVNGFLRSLLERVDTTIEELLKCTSANTQDFGMHDRRRLDEALESHRSFMEWIVSQPIPDTPKTDPRSYAIKWMATETTRDIENRDIRDIVVLLENVLIEMSESGSARQAHGMVVHDYNRFLLLMDELDQFLIGHVDDQSPLDRPETSPHGIATTAGKKNSTRARG